MKKILIVLTILSFVSCQLKEKEMTYSETIIKDVMYDLYIASEAMKRANDDTRDSLKEVYISQIEKIHAVSISQYEDDINILKKDPIKYEKWHKEVRDSLNNHYKYLDDLFYKK